MIASAVVSWHMYVEAGTLHMVPGTSPSCKHWSGKGPTHLEETVSSIPIFMKPIPNRTKYLEAWFIHSRFLFLFNYKQTAELTQHSATPNQLFLPNED